MTDDYLWDRSGPADPEIERLEKALAPLRYRHRPLRQRHPGAALAAAAAVLLCAGLLLWPGVKPAPLTAWHVVDGSADAALRHGAVLRTGPAGTATLEAAPVGRIDLGPHSELRIGTSRQVELRHGDLHAFIWAPPRQFEVETPSARAVDLGCEYTLHVDAAGNGLLRVSLGWVAFQFQGRESFIPAGAACITRPGRGPGTPFFEDASEPFRRSLAAFETGDSTALMPVLAEARSRDALTLWHLLTRVTPPERGPVFDRFARLVTLPPEATRADAVRQDPRALDLCWNALHLESAGWWRSWERPWPK